MAKTVLYVHGTGVRKQSFEASAARIASGLARTNPSVKLAPCLWGDALGARLGLDGASIPEYVKSPTAAAGDEENVALWDLLARDCLFELRELAASASTELDPPLVLAAKQALRDALVLLATDVALLARLDGFATPEQWQLAVITVRQSAVLNEAIDAVRIALGPLRLALGRAIVAALQAQLADLTMPGLPKAMRDQLVVECAERMGGAEAGGLLDWFTSRLVGLGLGWATAKARRKREALYGVAAPTAGDVVMYQARGQAIRDFIEERIRKIDDEVVIIAHSLGGIACVDLLILKDLPQVKALVTVGSQAPFLYEINALGALPFKAPLPEHFPQQWLNFYDCNDLLSYRAAPVFAGRAQDVEIASGQPFPHSHSAYWDEQLFWDRLEPLLD
jgi:hypothetical protein